MIAMQKYVSKPFQTEVPLFILVSQHGFLQICNILLTTLNSCMQPCHINKPIHLWIVSWILSTHIRRWITNLISKHGARRAKDCSWRVKPLKWERKLSFGWSSIYPLSQSSNKMHQLSLIIWMLLAAWPASKQTSIQQHIQLVAKLSKNISQTNSTKDHLKVRGFAHHLHRRQRYVGWSSPELEERLTRSVGSRPLTGEWISQH